MNSRFSYLFISLVIASHCVYGQDSIETQARFNLMVGHNVGNALYLQADLEYRTLIASDSYSWQAFEFTLFALYTPTRLIDFSLEIANSLTQQTPDLSTYETDQRIGIRWYILQRGHNLFRLKKMSKGAPARFELSNFIRFEHRSFDYYGDFDSKQEWRIRNRTQLIIALNKPTLTENKVLHFQSDIEFFTPNAPDVKERFASLYRVRAGFGYRQSFQWRYTLLYMYDKSRSNIEDEYKTKSHMLNFQLLIMF